MKHIRRVVGLAAMLSVAALLAGCTGGGSADLGATIFKTGQGHAGRIPRSIEGEPSTTEGLPCAGCHGVRGQGTGVGPPITRATLGSSHTIRHRPSAANPKPQPVAEGPWTPDQTVEVVKTGKTPEGNSLGGRMPRWQLDSQDASALAAFLGTL